MSRSLALFPVSLALLLGVLLFAAAPEEKPSLDERWKQVDEAVKKGLPKTAIERLNPIIETALEEKNYDEAIRAIGQKIALEGNIQGNKPEEKIKRMQEEVAKAPAEMKPLMHAILAHWYWQYYQSNRWRFLQRTQTDEAPGEDFTTWALPRLFSEIDKQLQAALEDEEKLKSTPVSEFEALLVAGTAGDSYRPTMYDFLAHLALHFYSSGEQASVKAQDAFEISAESPIFAPAEQFVNWQPETEDTDSPNYRAIKLYQSLLKFHAEDQDQTAWRDANLLRLKFGYNKAFGDTKNDRYKAALERFAEKYADDEIAARALHLWASVLQGENELVEAHKIASRGLQRFPNSVGGKRCYNVIQQIEAPSIDIKTERVWNEPLPSIDVNYRNLTKAWFRVVKGDWEKQLTSGSYSTSLNNAQKLALLRKDPVKAWSKDLPPTEDYQQRQEEIPAPEDLEPGYYHVICSANEAFGEVDNQVKFTSIWVSDLAIVIRSERGTGKTGGFVLNAITGEPIANAEVQSYLFSYQNRGQNRRWKPGPKTTTNENGLYEFKPTRNSYMMVLVKQAEQTLASESQVHSHTYNTTPKPYSRTIFFTDRSLYRPGQTVQYKGLCIDVHANQNNYDVLANKQVTVVFYDPNRKEIARQKHRTNDYGSFNGSFTAPRDRLMGRMSLQVEGTPNGATYFNVEEYKRPKFRVELAAPEKAAKLGGEVELKGTATAYTGAAIDSAEVNWRVVREVRYPIWWRYRFWWRPMNNNSQEIAHGSATTAVDGTFPIEFVAKPDESVSPKDEPTFVYKVYADVTDNTGETRSNTRSIRLGYTALSASLSAEDWQTTDEPAKISVRTTTLDGEGQVAEGTLKIYQLKQPEKVHRASLGGRRYYGQQEQEPKPDLSNINSWELGEMVDEAKITTDGAGNATYEATLEAGAYRLKFETQDRFGKQVTAELPLKVIDPDAPKLAIKIPDLFAAPKWTVEPGEEFMAVWGSGYDRARAYVEVEHRNKLLQSYWTKPGRTKIQIKQEVMENMRGGFIIRVTMVRENRAYLHSRRVEVPWSNKDLTIKWEHFVSKLKPAEQETWTAKITGPDAESVVAEMVAGLYDASLDAYLPNSWMQSFNVFYTDQNHIYSQFENSLQSFRNLRGSWKSDRKQVEWTYRSLPQSILSNLWGYQYFGDQKPQGLFQPFSRLQGRRAVLAAEGQAAMAMDAAKSVPGDADRKQANGRPAEKADQQGDQGPDLSQVTARKNLNETAFFFPHLVANDSGEIRMEFTMPEALTEWKFMGFAHDPKLRSGYLQDTVVTAKDLMVQPNPPRFVREGDVIEFTVKVSNQSPTRQTGKVRLTLADARTTDSVDQLLGNEQTDQSFDIPSKESRTFSWKISVPDGMGFLKYTAVGATDRLSDGEEGYLPVLSRRIFLTESMPLPIRGEQTKQFQFEKLLNSGDSKTLQHQSVTVQMVSNPSWYAVLALPYLMEYPHQCSEQVFNRLYANALARHIANSDPKIRRIFDLWKQQPGDTFESPLMKNEDLKAVMVEETPWLRQANAETEARRQLGILFDDNRLKRETARTLAKLAEMQRADGSWPWFPGGPSNDYITLYITTGFGRMRHLGVQVDTSPAVKALGRLDNWIDRTYQNIKDKDKYHLSSTIALYLYGRSFFLGDKAIEAKHKPAVDYFLQQARDHWLKLANRQSQAHLAVALKRFGDVDTAKAIMRSIKERSVSDEELGMFWRDTERSWWWYRAPIETQAMMIEAFDEVMNDAEAVEDCKVWLLKQKQTQDWKTTKATADAVYALLLRGSNLLASDELVQVTVGEKTIAPQDVEAGTGFYEETFVRGEVQPKFGQITVKKLDPGVAWGSIHWQYLEDISKITPHDGTPLQLTKQLYIKENTEKGPVLNKVDGPIEVGDELVVRLVLRTDRSMEYIHLKDQRGSGTEPVNVLSRYKLQDGLYYYESTRDTASHFFIDYLPKGTYVFEYSVRVQLRGEYEAGMAQIQCMYAPEFNSHSASTTLKVE